jgi:hypothetical protein
MPLCQALLNSIFAKLAGEFLPCVITVHGDYPLGSHLLGREHAKKADCAVSATQANASETRTQFNPGPPRRHRAKNVALCTGALPAYGPLVYAGNGTACTVKTVFASCAEVNHTLKHNRKKMIFGVVAEDDRLGVHEGGCSDGGPVLGGDAALDESPSSGRQNLIGKVHVLHRPGHRHRSDQTRIKEQGPFMALLFGEHRKLLMYGAGEKLVDADGVIFKSLAVLGRGTLHVGAERGENASVTDLQKSVFGEILLDHGL